MKQTFTNQTGDSNKYWAIEQNENSITVCWGKIGTQGRTLTKEFPDVEACQTEMNRLIDEKTKKGYLPENASATTTLSKISNGNSMNEDVYWQIIASFNWDETGDDGEVLKPAVKKLAKMSVEDIYQFEEILAEKLYLLDGKAHASNIGDDSYKGDDKHFSVDYFLYVRCCVVANGKAYFEKVLKNPEKMPKELDFEAILTLSELAYEKKTKSDDFDFSTKFNYETFSNVDAWNIEYIYTEPESKAKKWWKFW